MSQRGKYIVDESNGQAHDDSEDTLAPWELNSYTPVSWLEMLEFSARGFFWLSQYLEHIKLECYLVSMPIDGDTPIFNLMTPLDERVRTKTLGMLKHAEKQCREIGLTIAADTITDIAKDLGPEAPPHNCQWLLDQTRGVQKLVERELKGKVFIYSPPERSKFFPMQADPYAFGEAVANAFPSAAYDIHESALCLALARSSASVFHLMRALETGLTILGAKFNVSLLHTNWAPALEQIESKIRDMHKDPAWKALANCKELQEQYAQAASTFGVFKDAWRNHTMHTHGKYTEGEAELIFVNVKDFMQKLEALGLKETP